MDKSLPAWTTEGKINYWTLLGPSVLSPRGERKWLCRCECGAERYVLERSLKSGYSRSCGCKTVKKYAYKDITGKTFARLTAIKKLSKRDSNGNVVWLCECECGNVVEVSYGELMYAGVKSCGCMRREHQASLKDTLTHVAGTSINAVKSSKVPTNNTTGVRGVYRVGNRYMAKIVFQKKQYHLGSYATLEEASRARRDAEELLFDAAAEHYERWKSKADVFPEWAEANPVRFIVSKDSGNTLNLTCLPEL